MGSVALDEATFAAVVRATHAAFAHGRSCCDRECLRSSVLNLRVVLIHNVASSAQALRDYNRFLRLGNDRTGGASDPNTVQ
jgi:hypothetical protein